jgi:hypothetical protein
MTPAEGSGAWDALPPRNPAFRGRAAELAELERRSGRASVSVLAGLIGTGKSTLAVEFAHDHLRRGGSVMWLDARDSRRVAGPLSACRILLARQAAGAPALVVLDGVIRWDDVEEHLPPEPAHVLITSAVESGWAERADVHRVGPWGRAESVAFLREANPALSPEDADRIAEVFKDLPLGVAFASRQLVCGLTADLFLALLQHNPAQLLAADTADPHGVSLADRFQRARRALGTGDALLTRLADAAAGLGPAPLPLRPLRAVLSPRPALGTGGLCHDIPSWQLDTALREVGRSQLATLSEDMLTVSPLYSALASGLLTPAERVRATEMAEVFLTRLVPGPRESDAWEKREQWQRVLPLFLAFDPAKASTREGLDAIGSAYGHLLDAGQWREAVARLEILHAHGAERAGDSRELLRVSMVLLRAYETTGDHDRAFALGSTLLDRYKQALGPTDPHTLRCASMLIVATADRLNSQEAIDLAQGVLSRQCKVLGPDHRDSAMTITRWSAVELAAGEPENAADAARTALRRLETALSAAHPDALTTAHQLALALRAPGTHADEALDLMGQTYVTRLAVLGEKHPHTVRSAAALAVQHHEVYRECRGESFCWDTLTRVRRAFGPMDGDAEKVAGACEAVRARAPHDPVEPAEPPARMTRPPSL